ncbi:MAG: Fic family protein [Salinivirgaceae bacterium]|nr:Fic family protein [Salinivirgaceae bacterium]
MLIKELAVEHNLRKRRVGISGTNYRSLDNEFKISEALRNSCDVINSKVSVFEKSLLALVLISYIQLFMDGNKRTARIVSNAILMNEKHCPLSFRTVDSIAYKKGERSSACEFRSNSFQPLIRITLYRLKTLSS